MAFPVGWPPRPSPGYRSLRFFVEGTATLDFEDNAFLFIDGVGANPYAPLPVVRPGDDLSRFPQPAATVIPNSGPFGGGENDPGSVKAMIWSFQLQIRMKAGARLEFSFDGVNVHGVILAGDASTPLPFQRSEAGIAIRGGAGGETFVVEAW